MTGALAKKRFSRKRFGTSDDRRLREYQPQVDAINALEAKLAALSDEALRARTDAFKADLAEGKARDGHRRPAPERTSE
jgi:preprotein translocase subunit SecA